MQRIPYPELQDRLERVLLAEGFQPERAALCARLFAEASRDGVYSHGLNRFPRFIEMIHRGVIDIHAQPERVSGFGALERWIGHRGPGNLNARTCMERAIELAREHGLGCVALADTNHWMRGGSYGWQAADAGMIGICWTNTTPNLPAWGTSEARLGNNPLIIAIPRPAGHVVLDMAASQFSYGALESYQRRGELLPVIGGMDEAGALTRDPGAILRSGRPLPIGFWKGAGLALVLDMVAALLSGGWATHQVPADALAETGLSQLFLTIDPRRLSPPETLEETAERIIADFLEASASGEESVRYPGQRMLETRERNLRDGVPVDPEIWSWVAGLPTSPP